MSKRHIDVLVNAALQFPAYGSKLRFAIKERKPLPTDHMRGEPWGPTSIRSFREIMREVTRENASDVGALLWAENVKSYDHRYDGRYKEDHPTEAYVFKQISSRLEPLVVLRALASYEYQSCEHPGWTSSAAYSFCQSLRKWCIEVLPGYSDAPGWSVADDTPVTVHEFARMRALEEQKKRDEAEALAKAAVLKDLPRRAQSAGVKQKLRAAGLKVVSVGWGRGTASSWLEITLEQGSTREDERKANDMAVELLGRRRNDSSGGDTIFSENVSVHVESDHARDKRLGKGPA